MRGRTLSIPIGSQRVARAITGCTRTIEVSLRTHDPREARLRHAEVGAYLSATWRDLCDGAVTLTHRQVRALAV